MNKIRIGNKEFDVINQGIVEPVKDYARDSYTNIINASIVASLAAGALEASRVPFCTFELKKDSLLYKVQANVLVYNPAASLYRPISHFNISVSGGFSQNDVFTIGVGAQVLQLRRLMFSQVYAGTINFNLPIPVYFSSSTTITINWFVGWTGAAALNDDLQGDINLYFK